MELGWRLKRHCWGQGIATEAARTILNVIQMHTAPRVFCEIADADNLASTGVMKKLGMQFIDKRLHHTSQRIFEVDYYEMPAK